MVFVFEILFVIYELGLFVWTLKCYTAIVYRGKTASVVVLRIDTIQGIYRNFFVSNIIHLYLYCLGEVVFTI